MAFVCTTSASAAVTLDQSTFSSGSGFPLGVGMFDGNYPVHQTQLQTLTVGQTGQLVDIDLKVLHESGSGKMALYVFNNGYLGTGVPANQYTDILGKAIVDSSALPQDPNAPGYGSTDQVTSFDLSAANIFVSQGQVISFSLRSEENFGVTNTAYLKTSDIGLAGAKNYVSSNIGLRYLDYGDPDVQFRSFVNVGAAVPEPASWAMMIVGFGMAGSMLRRRRTNVRFA